MINMALVEYQCQGGRKGIAKCLVHLRMKQIYLHEEEEETIMEAEVDEVCTTDEDEVDEACKRDLFGFVDCSCFIVVCKAYYFTSSSY